MTPHTSFFANDTELRHALAAAQGTDLDVRLATTLLSRIIWARLCEPGDRVAGSLIAALGPEHAFDLVAQGASAKTTLGVIAASGFSPAEFPLLTHARVTAAMQRWRPRLSREETLNDLNTAAANGFDVMTPDHADWPSGLADLEHAAPPLLWFQGNVSALNAGGLAIVGARACTNYGRELTSEFAEYAASAGIMVISGAAYGIDAAAHHAALSAQKPTVAVLAGGLDRPYPAGHTALIAEIARGGAVCSEVVPGTAPTRWRFLQRNRLIAALAHATLVTEAGARSGSLNTAGHAAELGRPLAAVPGPITSPASAGCHAIIRNLGAELVSNTSELCEFLRLDSMSSTPETSGARQLSIHRRVLDALPLRNTRSTAETSRVSGLTLADARQALAELELLGFVERDPLDPQNWRLLKRE
ncbi:DNA-protecting protein DprA [Leucobacter sp. cx-42]|uniref:DNA-processing protein DprA n=1 Tax=unclassified Leucobacter TaxID=2621730 RepID=UPI00165EB771|nr:MULTISPECIES: DNA-processing protein DprA [unclassified Leucobacter]MBC9955195.1 DNA-protecting protein DprA [Leucobacter sp. cx-42]